MVSKNSSIKLQTVEEFTDDLSELDKKKMILAYGGRLIIYCLYLYLEYKVILLIDFDIGCPKYPTSCGGYSNSSEGGRIQATEHISKEPFSCDWVLVSTTRKKQIIITFSVSFY